MTDTLDGNMDAIASGELTDDTGGEPGQFTGLPPGRQCAEEGCENEIPAGSHQARKYCDEHFKGKGGRAERRRKGNTGERAPKLVLDVGGGKRPAGGAKEQRARDTAAGAKAFANVIATGFAMSGDTVCAAAVATGADHWGDAVGELSKYQPWLSTFFAPVGGESQLGAWLAFAMTTGAIAVPVLAHHGMLPEAIGAKMAGVMVAADDFANDQQQSPAA